MSNNLKDVIKLVFGSEGGYVNHPKDPGGATKFGITASTLGAWRHLGRSATPDEVKALNLNEASDILSAQYARPLWYDKLPAGLDYALFDYGVNSGPTQAVKTLQRILGVDVDGLMGVKTFDVIKNYPDLSELINKLQDARLKFLKGLKTWSTFKNGWSNRVAHVRVGALSMVVVEGSVVEPVAIPDVVAAPEGQESADPADIKFTSSKTGPAAVTTIIGTASAGIGATKEAIQAVVGVSDVFNYVLIGLGVAGTVAAVAGIAWSTYIQITKTASGEGEA